MERSSFTKEASLFALSAEAAENGGEFNRVSARRLRESRFAAWPDPVSDEDEPVKEPNIGQPDATEQHTGHKHEPGLAVVLSVIHLLHIATDIAATKVLWNRSSGFGCTAVVLLLAQLVLTALNATVHLPCGPRLRPWLWLLTLPLDLASLSLVHVLPWVANHVPRWSDGWSPAAVPVPARSSKDTDHRSSQESNQQSTPSSVQNALAVLPSPGCKQTGTQQQQEHAWRSSKARTARNFNWLFEFQLLLCHHRPAFLLLWATTGSLPMAALQLTAVCIMDCGVELKLAAAASLASCVAAALELVYEGYQLVQQRHSSEACTPANPASNAQACTALWVMLCWHALLDFLRYQAGAVVPGQWQQRMAQQAMHAPLHEMRYLPSMVRAVVLRNALSRGDVVITNTATAAVAMVRGTGNRRNRPNSPPPRPSATIMLSPPPACNISLLPELLRPGVVLAASPLLGSTASSCSSVLMANQAAQAGSKEVGSPQAQLHTGAKEGGSAGAPLAAESQQPTLLLKLASCEEMSGGTRSLAACLRVLMPHALTHLHLRDVRLQLDAFMVLSAALSAPGCQLRILALKEVNLSRVSLQYMCTALATNTSVSELDLSSSNLNQLGPKTPLDIKRMLEGNRALTKLNLAYTGLGSEAAAEVLLGAACSHSLTHLDLSQNRVSDCLPASLLRAYPLEQPPPLTRLNMGFNWIQDCVPAWLLLCLTLFPRLTHVWLDHCGNQQQQLGAPRRRRASSLLTRVKLAQMERSALTERLLTGRPSLSDRPSLPDRRSQDSTDTGSQATPTGSATAPSSPRPASPAHNGMALLAHLHAMPQIAERLHGMELVDLAGLLLPVEFRPHACPGLRCSWAPLRTPTPTVTPTATPTVTPAPSLFTEVDDAGLSWPEAVTLSEQLITLLQQPGYVMDLGLSPWNALPQPQRLVALYTFATSQTRLLITNMPSAAVRSTRHGSAPLGTSRWSSSSSLPPLSRNPSGIAYQGSSGWGGSLLYGGGGGGAASGSNTASGVNALQLGTAPLTRRETLRGSSPLGTPSTSALQSVDDLAASAAEITVGFRPSASGLPWSPSNAISGPIPQPRTSASARTLFPSVAPPLRSRTHSHSLSQQQPSQPPPLARAPSLPQQQLVILSSQGLPTYYRQTSTLPSRQPSTGAASAPLSSLMKPSAPGHLTQGNLAQHTQHDANHLLGTRLARRASTSYTTSTGLGLPPPSPRTSRPLRTTPGTSATERSSDVSTTQGQSLRGSPSYVSNMTGPGQTASPRTSRYGNQTPSTTSAQTHTPTSATAPTSASQDITPRPSGPDWPLPPLPLLPPPPSVSQSRRLHGSLVEHTSEHSAELEPMYAFMDRAEDDLDPPDSSLDSEPDELFISYASRPQQNSAANSIIHISTLPALVAPTTPNVAISMWSSLPQATQNGEQSSFMRRARSMQRESNQAHGRHANSLPSSGRMPITSFMTPMANSRAASMTPWAVSDSDWLDSGSHMSQLTHGMPLAEASEGLSEESWDREQALEAAAEADAAAVAALDAEAAATATGPAAAADGKSPLGTGVGMQWADNSGPGVALGEGLEGTDLDSDERPLKEQTIDMQLSAEDAASLRAGDGVGGCRVVGPLVNVWATTVGVLSPERTQHAASAPHQTVAMASVETASGERAERVVLAAPALQQAQQASSSPVKIAHNLRGLEEGVSNRQHMVLLPLPPQTARGYENVTPSLEGQTMTLSHVDVRANGQLQSFGLTSGQVTELSPNISDTAGLYENGRHLALLINSMAADQGTQSDVHPPSPAMTMDHVSGETFVNYTFGGHVPGTMPGRTGPGESPTPSIDDVPGGALHEGSWAMDGSSVLSSRVKLSHTRTRTGSLSFDWPRTRCTTLVSQDMVFSVAELRKSTTSGLEISPPLFAGSAADASPQESPIEEKLQPKPWQQRHMHRHNDVLDPEQPQASLRGQHQQPAQDGGTANSAAAPLHAAVVPGTQQGDAWHAQEGRVEEEGNNTRTSGQSGLQNSAFWFTGNPATSSRSSGPRLTPTSSLFPLSPWPSDGGYLQTRTDSETAAAAPMANKPSGTSSHTAEIVATLQSARLPLSVTIHPSPTLELKARSNSTGLVDTATVVGNVMGEKRDAAAAVQVNSTGEDSMPNARKQSEHKSSSDLHVHVKQQPFNDSPHLNTSTAAKDGNDNTEATAASTVLLRPPSSLLTSQPSGRIAGRVRGTLVVGNFEAGHVLHVPLKELLMPVWAGLATAREAATAGAAAAAAARRRSLSPHQQGSTAVAMGQPGLANNSLTHTMQQGQGPNLHIVSNNDPSNLSVSIYGGTSGVAWAGAGPSYGAVSGFMQTAPWGGRQRASLDMPSHPEHSLSGSGTGNVAAAVGNGSAHAGVPWANGVGGRRRGSLDGPSFDSRAAGGLMHPSKVLELYLMGVPESQDLALDSLVHLVHVSHPAYAARVVHQRNLQARARQAQSAQSK